MTIAPTVGPYWLVSGDGIVEMRFSTMAKRNVLRVEEMPALFQITVVFRERLFHSHRGFSPVLRMPRR
jgi:hypothetical protein